MKISKPKLVMDLYEWLPGYGESKVSFLSEGIDVLLEVEYERGVPNDNGGEDLLILKRKISFKSVQCFIKTPFPGKFLFEFEGESSEFKLGKLTEFTDSEWAHNGSSVWRSKSSHASPPIRHFSVQFMSENVAFHILAEGVYLSDERTSD